MAFYNNMKYGPDSPKLRLLHAFGIPACARKLMQFCDISYNEEYLKIEIIEPTFGKKDTIVFETYKIPNERILAVEILSQTNIQEKNRSVIGRGIVGGMLFGPAGMHLGAMSGLQTNRKITVSYFLSFAYIGKEDEDVKNIMFQVQQFMKPCSSFAEDYRQRLPQPIVERNEAGEVLL